MAGDWIKMRVDLATDPAVISIASSLDVTEFEVVGMLHHFWSWVDAQSRDGHAAGVTKKWIDRYVHRDGFSTELEKTGWLIADDTGITIPNFDRHNGASAKTRALAKDRQKNKRENSSRETSRIERDESVTREEKIREEVIPPICPPTEAKEKPAPRKTKIPTPFMLTAEMRTWASESVPGVDLKSETEKFVDYWRGEAKTKADWPATWRNWMRKAQQDHNRPPMRGVSTVNRQQQVEDANARVVREIAEREARRHGHQPFEQSGIDLGDVVAVDGEVIRVE